MRGSFPDTLLYDDEQKNGDSDAFEDAVGDIGAGWDQLLQEEAADEEDQGQTHQNYFEGTIHCCILTAKIGRLGPPLITCGYLPYY